MNQAPSPTPAPSAASSTAPSRAPSEGAQPAAPRPGPVPPLVPVLLTLVVAAIVLAVVLAHWFPAADAAGPAPGVRFSDVTAESGVAVRGRGDSATAPTTLGGGVTVLDFNRDGRPDLFFPGNQPWPWQPERAPVPSALYRNDGNGRFTEVTAAARLDAPLQGMHAVSGDYDADGWPDLFVTCVGGNHLFRNRGDGTFEESTTSSGVGGDEQTWSTAAAWLDFDHDGALDLVVAHYARWPHEVPLGLAFAIADVGRSYGTPTGFVGAFPTVYRNRGDGRFEPVRDGAGLHLRDLQTGLPQGKPLALVVLDANADGRLDLLFTFHTSERVLFLDTGDGGFRRATGNEERHEGPAVGLPGSFAAAGGVDERAALLPLFESAAATRRDGELVTLREKLGVASLDCDFDGRLEWLSGEGLLERDLNKFDEPRRLAGDAEIVWRSGHGWSATAVLPSASGSARSESGAGESAATRGAAVADFDGDGDLDAVLGRVDGGVVRILRNDLRSGAPWLRLRLIATRSHPDAGGARVEVQTPRRTHTQTVAPALGFFAQSESTLTFGLGDDARVRRVVIHWPSGQQQEFRPDGLNRVIELREP